MLGMALGAACLCAVAQTVYRCGSTYGQTPCEGGQVIDTRDPLSTQQAGKNPGAAERDAKAAAALEKDRLQLEARAAPAFVPAATQPVAASRQAAGRLHKPELFTAVEPVKPGNTKKKPGRKQKKKATAKA